MYLHIHAPSTSDTNVEMLAYAIIVDLCVCLCVVQLFYQHMQLVLESCSIWSVVTYTKSTHEDVFFPLEITQVSVACVQAFNIHLIIWIEIRVLHDFNATTIYIFF